MFYGIMKNVSACALVHKVLAVSPVPAVFEWGQSRSARPNCSRFRTPLPTSAAVLGQEMKGVFMIIFTLTTESRLVFLNDRCGRLPHVVYLRLEIRGGFVCRSVFGEQDRRNKNHRSGWIHELNRRA